MCAKMWKVLHKRSAVYSSLDNLIYCGGSYIKRGWGSMEFPTVNEPEATLLPHNVFSKCRCYCPLIQRHVTDLNWILINLDGGGVQVQVIQAGSWSPGLTRF